MPLPFVAAEAPIALKGQSRSGPSLRESILMHAVARLVLGAVLPNIQASWVKLGAAGAQRALQAGANDLGGTLMNESITRSAGASHGEAFSLESLRQLVTAIDRKPSLRTTLYQPFPAQQQQKAEATERQQIPLEAITLSDAKPSKTSQQPLRLLPPGAGLSPLEAVLESH